MHRRQKQHHKRLEVLVAPGLDPLQKDLVNLKNEVGALGVITFLAGVSSAAAACFRVCLRASLLSSVCSSLCSTGLICAVRSVSKTLVRAAKRGADWPLQYIVLLRGFCAQINHLFIAPSHLHCPHCCNTIARKLRNI